MNFIFSWQKQYCLILFCHSKIKFISSRHGVISSIYLLYTRGGVSNRWKSMIGKPIDQSISVDKIIFIIAKIFIGLLNLFNLRIV